MIGNNTRQLLRKLYPRGYKEHFGLFEEEFERAVAALGIPGALKMMEASAEKTLAVLAEAKAGMLRRLGSLPEEE